LKLDFLNLITKTNIANENPRSV